MTPDREALLDSFAQSPEGTRTWLPGLGRSMAPLLSSGDAIEFERTHRARKGDLALVRRGMQFIAHVVIETNPLRTASIRGVADEGALELVGRAIAVRKRGIRLPVPLPARLGLLAFITGYEALLRSGRAAGAARALRDAALGPRTGKLRALFLAPVTIRPLDATDTQELIHFTSDQGRMSEVFARSRLAVAAGVTMGAFNRHGELLGICLCDDYQHGTASVMHKLFVARQARHIGVGEGLLRACLDDARKRGRLRAFANARDADHAAKRLLQRVGFRPDAAVVQELRTAAALAPLDAFDGYVVVDL